MKTNKLAQVIRKIVQEEVQKEVRIVLAEHNCKDKINSEIEGKKSLTLTEALNHTEAESYPTMKEFTSDDARAGFAAMQTGFNSPQSFAPSTVEGHNGQVISVDKVDPSLNKALTRDYSSLVKRFKK